LTKRRSAQVKRLHRQRNLLGARAAKTGRAPRLNRRFLNLGAILKRKTKTKMSVREPIAILISDIDPSKITLSVPKKGQGSAKPETYVSYDGRPLAIQFGTATEPLKCPYGLERWVQSKPERVKSSNPDWAVNDNTLFNKVRTAKLSGNLRLNNHADANSADAKAVEKMNAIVYRIVECFVSGVQD